MTADSKPTFDVLVVGGGAAGLAAASSLLNRAPDLNIALVDPAETHFYQPGWTMIGGGVFKPDSTGRPMASLIPKNVTWYKQAVRYFAPEQNSIELDNGKTLGYERLVVAPGLKLDWDRIEGLAETLGRNGVTSNYSVKTAPYTWELVQNLQSGKAVFTQPPMPIKCAGAPQKAMYLSSDHWYRQGRLGNIEIGFYNAGAVLFGVAAYVPALMEYIEKYGVDLHFEHTLTAVDGERKIATFKTKEGETVETDFDMLHVCPPQCAPDFVRESPLADAAGWLDVNPDTLQHVRYENIWCLGDACNAPNAKTAAAARAQAPVVAVNLLHHAGRLPSHAHYDGYGSCPLTVERGKIVLAEFGYGGQLKPSFPKWLLDGEKPSQLAWLLKAKILPPIYWHAMLKGREWMVKPIHQV
jgi:sulfide:quinone oxidoreductase